MKSIKIIPSKSDAHRAYIAAALSEMQSVAADARNGAAHADVHDASGAFDCIICEETSEDIEATKRCLNALLNGEEELHCGESGSTLRFLLPVVGAIGSKAVFYPEGRLAERPMEHLIEELCAHGMRIHVQSVPAENPKNAGVNKASDRETISDTLLIAEGKLMPGTYRIPGNVSSQYISGLLFALPLLDGDSEIIVEGVLESSPYVDMTVETLERFGITIEDETEWQLNPLSEEKEVTCAEMPKYMVSQSRSFFVQGNQKYMSPHQYRIEGDWSNAAFWLAMGALGNEAIRVEGLRNGSMQADERILDALDVFGVYFEMGSSRSRIEGTESGFHVDVYPSKDRMQGIIWDASETPDIVPVIALLAAFAKGESRIVNAARLRLKESDRLNTVAETLRSLGAEVDELPDGLVIHGRSDLATSKDATQGTSGGATQGTSGGAPCCILDSHGDHRIAMMAAAASVALAPDKCRIKLSGWKAVNKSYPSFFDRLSELGLDGNIELI